MMPEISSLSPVSALALVKIDFASEIPLDKELTADCLVVTRTKLGELIPANNVAWLVYSVLNWFAMVLAWC